MRTRWHRRLRIMVVVLATVVVIPALATSAQADYWRGGARICELHDPGSRYERLYYPSLHVNGREVARMVVSQKRGAHRICVVDVRKYHAKKRYMFVSLWREYRDPSHFHKDYGRFIEYAGPVYRKAEPGMWLHAYASIHIGDKWDKTEFKFWVRP